MIVINVAILNSRYFGYYKTNETNKDDEPDKSQKGSFSCQFRNNSW